MGQPDTSYGTLLGADMGQAGTTYGTACSRPAMGRPDHDLTSHGTFSGAVMGQSETGRGTFFGLAMGQPLLDQFWDALQSSRHTFTYASLTFKLGSTTLIGYVGASTMSKWRCLFAKASAGSRRLHRVEMSKLSVLHVSRRHAGD